MLHDRTFLRFLTATVICSFGDSVLYLALGIWVKDLTGSNAMAGAVFFALAVSALAAPFIGHVADRFSRLRILVIVNVVMGLVVSSLLAVRSASDIWIVYAVAVLYGGALNLTSAARNGLLKDIVPDHKLPAANSALQTAGQALRLFSPLVGAGLYSWAGGRSLVLVDMVTFAVAVALLAVLRVSESSRERVQGERFFHQVGAGLRHIGSQPDLRNITLAVGFAMLVIGFFESVLFVVVQELHKPTSFYGVILTVQGMGAVLGGAVGAAVQRLRKEMGTVALGLGAMAASFLLMASNCLTLVMLSAFVLGVGMSWYAIGYATALQRRTPAHLQGRVTATSYSLVDLPQTASIALGAWLVAVVDYRIILLVMAGVAGVPSVWLLLEQRREKQLSQSASGLPAQGPCVQTDQGLGLG